MTRPADGDDRPMGGDLFGFPPVLTFLFLIALAVLQQLLTGGR